MLRLQRPDPVRLRLLTLGIVATVGSEGHGDSDGAVPHTPHSLAVKNILNWVDPFFSRLFAPLGPPVPWNQTTYGALLALAVVWAVRVYTTWGAWGNLTIDSGREMYVPVLLVEGKKLYRDVWFIHGPAGPYVNCVLFRLFGIHLEVLYWAGSLSALGTAILLYVCGMRLSSWIVGWTAGAVVILEGFQPSLFCFPLPYSFSAVYGCVFGSLFIWLMIRATTSTHWSWMLAAGTAAAVELLLKSEFGMACYLTLVPLILIRGV